MARVRRFGAAAVVAAMLALGLLATLNTARSIGTPFMGAVVFRNHFKGQWQVEPSTPPWWPALAGSRLEYDDVILDLDGVPYGVSAESQLAAASREGRRTVRVGILRAGLRTTIELPIARFTLGDFLDIALPDLINGLGLLLLAIAVLHARPDDVINRTFAITFALVAGLVWAPQPGLFVDTGVMTRGLQILWLLAFCTAAAPFLHLTFLIPEPARRMPRRLLAAAYVYAALLTAVYVAATLLFWRDPTADFPRRLTTLANAAQHAFGQIAGLLCTARLVSLLVRRDLSRRVRRQLLVLVAGLAFCLPYMAIKLMRSLGVHAHFWNGLDLRYTLLPLPISIAFLVLRYQTFRRAHPVVGGVMILGTSALVASVGDWALRGVDPQWTPALRVSPFVVLFGVALLASYLWSTATSWGESFARLFDWHRRSYAAARQFGQDVVGEHELKDTPAAIVSALVSRMELERAALWLWQEKPAVFMPAAHAGHWLEPPVQVLAPAALLGPGPAVRLQGDAVPVWLAPLRAEGIEIATILWASGRPVGLLGLGKRWDDEIFDERDLEIVDLVAQQSSLFLLTAAQIQQLRQVPHQIAQTQERERFKIAQELHDTVQQFLGRLPFYLEISRDAAREDPAETESILERCLADVAAAAQTVREIRANLAPLQLERSLSEPLRRLVGHFTARSGIASDVAIADAIDGCLGLEARHAVYRVVQQALDNVSAHAAAGRVRVTADLDNGGVRFGVADDGRGFSEEERSRAADRGSFGVASMRARIASLGGELSIESTPGQGTRVSGWLPLDAEERASESF